MHKKIFQEQKSRNKNYKNLGTEITKIQEIKFGNKNYKNPRNKITKI
jgi:hypothetical protein